MLNGSRVVIAVVAEIRLRRIVAGRGVVGRGFGAERRFGRSVFFLRRGLGSGICGIRGRFSFGFRLFFRTAATFFHRRLGVFRLRCGSGLLQQFILCGFTGFGLHGFHFVGHQFFLSDRLF